MYTKSQNDDESADCSVLPGDQDAAEAAAPSSTATGADVTVLVGHGQRLLENYNNQHLLLLIKIRW